MDRYLQVVYKTNWLEHDIIHIHSPFKNRSKVEEILSRLNAKYLGYGEFTYREVSVI